jgi:hypothetical protein
MALIRLTKTEIKEVMQLIDSTKKQYSDEHLDILRKAPVMRTVNRVQEKFVRAYAKVLKEEK